MASLITAAEKSALNSVMNSVHDTFSRLITVYKDAVQTVTTQSTSFNSIYGNAGATTSITYTPQSSQIYAAILYARRFDEDYFADQQDSQLKIKMQEGRIRVKIKASDYSTVKDGKRFEFDGQQFFRDSDFRAHGLFDVQFYTFYVKSSQ
jgi:tRNA threonylcarbamoyladenosine modification (KEOPS) complex  Pcc1 subunit